jgi:hypothetical protein
VQRRGSQLGCVLLAAAALGVSGAASAQDAQKLYDAGLKDMREGRYESGCPAIEQSYRLDAQPGALFTLAACYARWGKSYTAMQRYQAFLGEIDKMPPAERDKQQERIKAAREKLAELEPEVPTLSMSFSTPPPTGTTVEVDGRPLSPSELATPLKLDPGEHRVVVKTVEGDVKEYKEKLEPRAPLHLTLVTPTPAPATESDSTEQPAEGGGDGAGPQPMVVGAFVVGGIGLASIVVGAVTGGLVLGKKSVVDENCVDVVCNATGKDAVDQASTLAMVSNLTLGVGTAAVATGLVLLLVAPTESSEAEPEAVGWAVGSAPGDPSSLTVGIKGAWQ